jgi:membrane protease YdiL (CAAX protease family)
MQRHPLVAYFAIAFAGTWALTIPLALSTGFNLFPMPDIVFLLLFIFSIYTGPFLGALIVTRATEGGAGVRRLFKRTVQWRVGVRWYLAAIFSILLIWLVSYSILFRGAPLRQLIANPYLLVTLFLPWLLQGIFIPSLGEEVGWRGFALPRMQRRLQAILQPVLGALQGLWHLPVLFTPPGPAFTFEGFITFVLTATRRIPLHLGVQQRSRQCLNCHPDACFQQRSLTPDGRDYSPGCYSSSSNPGALAGLV